jgi:hypothetical protein
LSRKPRKDEALEAIDFIVNVLKQHEKDLDRLIAQLAKITNQITKKGELPTRIQTMEDTTVQTEISNLIQLLSTAKQAPMPATATPTSQSQPTQQLAQPTFLRGPPVIVRCKQWEDFKTLAQNADTVSFLYKEPEKTFQADALKQETPRKPTHF